MMRLSVETLSRDLCTLLSNDEVVTSKRFSLRNFLRPEPKDRACEGGSIIKRAWV
jgi:hypothetical protein